MLFDQLKRREFITLLGGAAIASPAATSAQVGRIYRVGLIFTTSPVSEMAGPDPIHPLVRSFVQGLATLGYLQGQNLLLEHRSAEGRFERFPEIIRELVASKVDAIVTVANLMTQAAKEVTGTVPIVMAYSVSPVEHGMVQSLSRPGGNVTGLAMNGGDEIPGKQLQILKELLPGISRLAFLHSKEQEERAFKTGRTGLDMVHIQYRGNGPGLIDLLDKCRSVSTPCLPRSSTSGRASCARWRCAQPRARARCRTFRVWLSLCRATRRGAGSASAHRRTHLPRSSTSSTRRSTPASPIPS